MTRALLFWGIALLLPAIAHAQQANDNPRLRWEDFYQRRAFPFDRIPPGALARARAGARALEAGAALRAAPPPISGTQWQALGPAAIPINGTSIGRISAIAVHPTDSNTIYIGGAQGGVWKTSDGGTNWAALTDGECSLAMGSIALDPVDPQIVYAGTGEQHFSVDSYYGCGVLRSLDGGGSWTQLGASAFGGAKISRIVIVPSTAGTSATTTLFAASDFGLFRSQNGGGVWNEVLVSGLGCSSTIVCSVTDLVIHPGNDQILYAAVRTRGVYKTTDGGATWVFMGSGFASTDVGRINIAITPTAPDTLYAAVHNPSTSRLLGIWWSTDGANSWSQRAATGADCGTQCWYDMYVVVHPTDPNTVYFGGVSLFRSANRAGSFGDIRGGIHVDQHLMVFDPQNPQTVYAANDGGIFRSRNGGSSWTSLSSGLELTQFYEGISLHPSERTIVLGGTQDNGTLQYNGVPRWLFVLGGDGGYTAIDRENPSVRYAETQWSSGSNFSGPRRSDGGSFSRKVNGINTSDRAQFIPPLVMGPSVSSTLYFGTFRIYKTTDRAESWAIISPDLTGGNGRVTAIAPAPSDPATIYVGSNSGLLQVTEDGGTIWNDRTFGLPLRFVQNIAVDRADAQTVYVVVSGFGSGHVFRTVDAGAAWADVSGALPDVPVNSIVLDPADRGFVMIGTDVGVFVSADSGGAWTGLTQGMPNVAVFDIAYNPATGSLIAATHGRGMFELQLNRPLTLAVVPAVRRDTVMVGATTLANDSADVVLTGMGSGTAGWTATHAAAATWITLGMSSGMGNGTVVWARDPTGLAGGVYVDTITVTAVGAVDSPWLVFDSLVVEGALTMLVTPGSRTGAVPVGSTGLRADSAAIQLSGTGASTTSWSAAATRGEWITVTTPSGTRSGTVRWTGNPQGLLAGVYVDTIVVTAAGAVGSPADVIDSLVVQVPAVVFNPASTRDTAISGTPGERPGSAQVVLAGGADSTSTWTVTHTGAARLTLLTMSGQGSQVVFWTRSAASLLDRVYADTLTVVTSNADTALIVDVFVVQAPAVTNACAADHILGGACLDMAQLRWLDLAGNNDGEFNVGDLVAFFARGGGASVPPGGNEP